MKLPFLFPFLFTISCPLDVPAQTRLEILGTIDVGGLKGVGAVGALGGDASLRHERIEWRVGTSRFGGLGGCMTGCDLKDARVLEVGAGVVLQKTSLARAWTAGALIARVSERLDTPRALAALYARRPWPIFGALVASTEVRIHAAPVRGFGTGAGWALRIGLGLASGASGVREP